MNAVVETINGAGGTFVDFAVPMLVQSGVLVVILLLIDAVLRQRVRAVFRYWIWMLVLVKLMLPVSLRSPVSVGRWVGDPLRVPTAALYEISESQPARPEAEPPSTAASVLSQDVARSVVTPLVPMGDSHPEDAYARVGMRSDMDSGSSRSTTAVPSAGPSLSWQGLVLLSWAAVAAVLLVLLLQHSSFVRGLVAQAEEASAAMQSDLDRCRMRLGLRREVALKLSGIAGSPAACGLIHPVILIPQSLTPRLSSHDLQAVLLHELAHIQRGDLWLNLIQTLAQIVYFYNPLLWLANAIIRRTREQAVDEAVLVAMGEAAQQYPETLVNIAKLAFRKRPGLSLRLIGVVESKSALGARIRHILSRPIPKSAKLGLLGLLAILIIAVLLLPMAQMLEPHATVANDGPLAIRFLGVCPDQSGDVLNGDGEKIEPIAYPRTGQAAWKADTLRRDFLFELPETNEPTLYSHHRLVSVAGEDIRLHQSNASPLNPVTVDGRRIAAVETYVPRVYRKMWLRFFRRTLATQRVDVTLKYFYGPPRQTLVSFQGPFTEGQVLAAAEMPGAKLTVLPQSANDSSFGPGASFRLDLPFDLDVGTPALVYDTEGRRSPAWASSMGTGGGRTTLEFRNYPEYMSLSDVARVVVEKPYAFTAKNIRVNYPDRPPRDHAAYLDVMAQRLGWTGTPEQLGQRQLRSSQEAIPVIDIVEGRHIQGAVDALEYWPGRVKVSSLDRATRERIHQTATRWVESGYTFYGIRLGLMGRWPEFVDMAVEELASPKPAFDYSYQEQAWIEQKRSIVSSLLGSEIKPNASQVEKLKRIALNTDDGPIVDRLLSCLGSTDTPEAVGALWELAQDDRPWIWWRAAEMWYSRTARTRRGYDDLSETMKLRLFLTSGLSVDGNLQARALALLPQMFTPELGQMASNVWNTIRERISRGSDRKAATETYLNYLRQMQSAITERQWVANNGPRYNATWMAAYVIRTLNIWYGTDFGNLGTEEGADSHKTDPKTLAEFQNLIAQALQWHEDHREVKPVEFVLQGKVVDTAGKPVATAQVSLTGTEDFVGERGERSQSEVDEGHYQTDADGSFVFKNLGNREHHQLAIRTEGFVTRGRMGVTRLPDGRFRIDEGTDNTIVMEKPASLSGRAIAPDGGPLANAEVQLVRYPGDRDFSAQAKTDTEGRFTAGSLISGSYLVRYCDTKRPIERGDIWSIKAFKLVPVEEGQSVEDVVLDLRDSTCSIEFEIVDRNGEPIAADLVTLEVPLPTAGRSVTQIATGGDIPAKRVHRLDNLPPVDGSLSVHVGGQIYRGVRVQLRPNQTARCRVQFDQTAAELEPLAPRREARWGKPFEVPLPNGVKVELLGLKDARAADNVWWAPDGSPLPAPVHTRNLGDYGPPGDAFRLEDTMEREITFRLSGVTDPNVPFTFELHTAGTGRGPAPVNSYRHSLIERTADGDIRSENVVLPRDAKGGIVRIGFDVPDEDGLWKDQPRHMWADFIDVTFQPGVRTRAMPAYAMPPATRRLEPAELDKVQRYVSVEAACLRQRGNYALTKSGRVTLFDIINAAQFLRGRDRTADAFLQVVRQVDLGGTKARLIYSRSIQGLFNGKESNIPLEPGDVIRGDYIERTRDEGTLAQEQFGDVIVITPKGGDTLQGAFIDLDTGTLHRPPADLDMRDSDALRAWMAANSIDARFDRAPAIRGLVGFNMLALKVDDKYWYGAVDIRDRLQAKAEAPVLLSGDDYPPATYLIKTDQQRMGILQLLGPSFDPDGMSIQYRFLKNQDRETDSQPPDPQSLQEALGKNARARKTPAEQESM